MRLCQPALPVLLAAMAIAACSSQNATPQGTGLPTCAPLPNPILQVFLAYPAPGATGVPATIGTAVIGEIGMTDFGSTATIALSRTSGSAQVPVDRGPVEAAPSPLPSPLATSDFSGSPTYFAYPLPTLSPATTYDISYDYTYGIGSPLQCQSNTSQFLGSFTTQ